MNIGAVGKKLAAKTDFLPGGFFIYRADESEEILYANEQVLRLFECETFSEFYQYVGGSFRGMVNRNELEAVEQDIAYQVETHDKRFDHVAYFITTKKGAISYVEDFGRLVDDPEEGPLYYVFIADVEIKSQTFEVDRVTGLMSLRRFLEASQKLLQSMMNSPVARPVAFIFVNIHNFKHYNIRYGLEAGDACLKAVGKILQDIFPQDYVARLNNDHFGVLTQENSIQERLEKVREAIKAISDEMLLEMKAGVFEWEDKQSIQPIVALDFAKIACDSIRNKITASVQYYSKEIHKQLEIYEYVSSHIDVALEYHWIKLYYQPVVRTLSKELCSMEALARWIDPIYGFLNPGQFISALEDSGQIYKLDIYIVRETCRLMRERMDKQLVVVPVSFNLSRLDFLLCNIFQQIEEAVDKYRIPRYMIHIEITESMLFDNGLCMQTEIQKFHDAGYQVWMDDFGSGYSSLNVLKDYQFDEIKLDMMFLSSFNDRSQAILTSTVDMAKKIGIQTLAEGVETEEQFEFLRSIGCEKVQGYLFGKPLPFQESIDNIISKGLKIASLDWQHYYDQAGRINVITDQPTAIFEDDGKVFRVLYANGAFFEQLKEMELQGISQLERTINSRFSSLHLRLREFADKLRHHKKEDVMFYSNRGQYLMMKFERSAEYEHKCLYRVTLINLSSDSENVAKQRLDRVMREVSTLFEDIVLIDFERDCAEPVLFSKQGESRAQSNAYGLKDYRRYMVEELLHPDDRQRYLDFVTGMDVHEHITESQVGYVEGFFRTKNQDGTYSWRQYIWLHMDDNSDNLVLLCVKQANLEDVSLVETIMQSENRDVEGKETFSQARRNQQQQAMLWRNLMRQTQDCYFWKDENRRFLGVSQAFLDYYGIKSLEDIVGKNDEEMHWHVDDQPYKSDELDVIAKGQVVRDAPGNCIIKGIAHSIVCNKWPLYDRGRIVGLMGYFRDADRLQQRMVNILSDVRQDKVTDLMNEKGFYEVYFDYEEQMQYHGRKFGLILVEWEDYRSLMRQLESASVDECLRLIADRLRNSCGKECSVARIKGGVFGVLSYFEKPGELENRAADIQQQFRGAFVVQQKTVELKLLCSITLCTEADSVEKLYQVGKKKLKK
ncbi:diguanylate cyclase (GGDEF) domain-containing protein [Selenomonas sp. WCT3]|uniref:EAL domain-containing protein n=1 Tax=Selenomonas sp. WCT3 TaxID=3158785 RepID=UPI00087E9A43|nr:diguanylate cyclase (GGDEF) domain-containing protein [Selenomonas ruminantium]